MPESVLCPDDEALAVLVEVGEEEVGAGRVVRLQVHPAGTFWAESEIEFTSSNWKFPHGAYFRSEKILRCDYDTCTIITMRPAAFDFSVSLSVAAVVGQQLLRYISSGGSPSKSRLEIDAPISEWRKTPPGTAWD